MRTVAKLQIQSYFLILWNAFNSENTVGRRLCWILGKASSWYLMKSKVNQISVWVCKPKYANYILAFKNLCWKNHCVQVWKTCWVFPIWHKWSILAFFPGKCCTEDLIKEFCIGLFPKCLEKTDFHSRPEAQTKNKEKINCVLNNQDKMKKYKLNNIT